MRGAKWTLSGMGIGSSIEGVGTPEGFEPCAHVDSIRESKS
jgi:hypothetical protein